MDAKKSGWVLTGVLVALLAIVGCGKSPTENPFISEVTLGNRLASTTWDYVQEPCVYALHFEASTFVQQVYCKVSENIYRMMASTGEYTVRGENEIVTVTKRTTCPGKAPRKQLKINHTRDLLSLYSDSFAVTLKPSYINSNPSAGRVVQYGCIDKNGVFKEHPWADVR